MAIGILQLIESGAQSYNVATILIAALIIIMAAEVSKYAIVG
jgi:hypothetical protein